MQKLENKLNLEKLTERLGLTIVYLTIIKFSTSDNAILAS